MAQTDQDLARDAAMSAVDRIESFDPENPPEEYADDGFPFLEYFDPLDVKFTVGVDGVARDVTAITGTGGPHIEVDLSGRSLSVHCYWGSDEFHAHVTENEDLLREVGDYFIEQLENYTGVPQ